MAIGRRARNIHLLLLAPFPPGRASFRAGRIPQAFPCACVFPHPSPVGNRCRRVARRRHEPSHHDTTGFLAAARARIEALRRREVSRRVSWRACDETNCGAREHGTCSLGIGRDTATGRVRVDRACAWSDPWGGDWRLETRLA